MKSRVTDPKQALNLLMSGNERFTRGLRSADALAGHLRLKDLAENGQYPFAIVLSCSDSRVPAELLFDCGFGDLFVVRVAGNVVQPTQIASIEYAAKVLGAPLCIVMGHSKCGAVRASLDHETGKTVTLGPNIDALLERIGPAVRRQLKYGSKGEGLLDRCIHENVRQTATELVEKSELLQGLIGKGAFRVVEAVVDLQTGRVDLIPVLRTNQPSAEPARLAI